MKITWLGHASVRIEIEGAILLVDPWLKASAYMGMDNPLFPALHYDTAIEGVTHVLITHGHADHIGNAVDICKATGAKMVCIADLADYMEAAEELDVIAANKGSAMDLNGAKVTMVPACHSSSFMRDGQMIYAGAEAGYIIAGDGHTIYLSGDTSIMADMEWIGDFHKPDIGIICAGGHYTMDMAQVAYAAKRYFNFTTLIPYHYQTFPLLEQSAQALIDALPDVDVKTPAVLEPLTF